MQIGKDKVVSFHYHLYEGETRLEGSEASQPMLYLHGHDGLFKGLEDALEGKQKGEAAEVTLLPEQAYGARRETPLQRVPIKHLMPRRKPRVGDVFQVNTDSGARQVVSGKSVGSMSMSIPTIHWQAKPCALRLILKTSAKPPKRSYPMAMPMERVGTSTSPGVG